MRSTPPDLAFGSGGELERRAVEFVGNRLGETEPRKQPIAARYRARTAGEKVAPSPPHDVSLPFWSFHD